MEEWGDLGAQEGFCEEWRMDAQDKEKMMPEEGGNRKNESGRVRREPRWSGLLPGSPAHPRAYGKGSPGTRSPGSSRTRASGC